MSLPLTAEQIAKLQPLVTLENYPAAYELLKVWTADSEDPDVQLFRTWLLGAADVNQGLGPFAALIGAYNMRQGELRGWPITPADNQAASDYIGEQFFNEFVFPESQIPDMEVLVNFEPNGARFLFENYPDDGDTAKSEGANWVGTLLISPFGFDRTNLLLTAGDSETALDTIDDLKNVLFAYDSFREAVWGIRNMDFTIGSAGNALQAMWNLPEGGRILGIPPQSLDHLDNIIASLAEGRVAADDFRLVRNLDKNDTLDHLMSAWLGRRTNRTTDETFVETASTFFQNVEGNVQRNTGLERLDDKTINELVTLALTDAKYRNALLSLSNFALDLESDQYRERPLDLYDEATGQGDMTRQYLQDRAAALKFFTGYDLSDRNDHFFSAVGLPLGMWGDVVIDDRASGERLTVDGLDLGIADNRYLMFGGEGPDELTGGLRDDRCYGGTGNDTLSGASGDDYLEGNDGSDTLNGGTGDDALYGQEDYRDTQLRNCILTSNLDYRDTQLRNCILTSNLAG
jgi:hypothetical protein